MTQINPAIALDESEFQEEFICSSVTDDQNVNKVVTAVQLSFNVVASRSLPDGVKERLKRLVRKRITQDGVIVVKARSCRTQKRNRQDALDRLAALISQSTARPIIRHLTKPTKASQQRRLESRCLHSQTKQARRAVSEIAD